jgi:paraquat-inducible protein B
MSERGLPPSDLDDVAEAVVETRSNRFSIIWLIPLVAALVGAFVAWRAFSERGPEITISFKTAGGLEAGKTKIRYKDVEIGQVENIDLSDDLSHVIVTAKLVKGAGEYLTDKTRFWVVRASIKAGQVSGLGTLLSGAYVGIDPVTEGQSARHFEGLDTPPVVTTGQPGRHFLLKAGKRGSLDIGSPVFYRQIQVGEVVAYDVGEDAESIDFRIFVHAPYDEKVRANTRFWNASGLDVSVTAQGIKVDTESMVSILIGGIAFAAPENEAPGVAAEEEHVFPLYDNHEATREKVYTEKRRFLLYFDGSVRGLSPGASVEFRGIQIGEVVDVKLELNLTTRKFQIPVVIDVEPERVAPIGQFPPEWARLEKVERQNRFFDQLVAQGLRAQLKTGSLITGKLYVDMDIYDKVKTAAIDYRGAYPVLPTVPTSLEEITSRVATILDKLEQFPIDKIGKNMDATLAGLQLTVTQTQKTLAALEKTLSTDSPLQQELQQTLEELAGAARSLRLLADYLERNPEAILRGKQDQ